MTGAALRSNSLLLSLLYLLAPWTSYVSTASADADDIVFFKNGGRTRGVVIDSDPVQGTRIKRYDGTIREIEASAIDHIVYGNTASAKPEAPPWRRGSQPTAAKPTPQPQQAPRPTAAPTPRARHEPAEPAYSSMQGALRIESTEPGEVFIEGGEYGATPLVIPNLSSGQHRVIVRFTLATPTHAW